MEAKPSRSPLHTYRLVGTLVEVRDVLSPARAVARRNDVARKCSAVEWAIGKGRVTILEGRVPCCLGCGSSGAGCKNGSEGGFDHFPKRVLFSVLSRFFAWSVCWISI